MLSILKMVAGPVLCSFVGYWTNFIAVKMLFFPKKEIRLFGVKVPFTPGVIPKGKSRIAKSVGTMVGSTLLTTEDLAKCLTDKTVMESISEKISIETNKTLKDSVIGLTRFTDDLYDLYKNKLAHVLALEITDSLKKINIDKIICSKGSEIIKEKVQGTMLQMFVNDSLIDSLTGPVGLEVKNFIDENGGAYIEGCVYDKLGSYESKSICEVLTSFDIRKEMLNSLILGVITRAVSSFAHRFLDSINISSVVEQKINDMSVEALEQMVLSVMKKELNAIVNLGALIGLVIGLVNLLF